MNEEVFRVDKGDIEHERIMTCFRRMAAWNHDERRIHSLFGSAARQPVLRDHVDRFYSTRLGFESVTAGTDSDFFIQMRHEWEILTMAFDLLNELYRRDDFMLFH